MITIYQGAIADYTKLTEYFKFIGDYNQNTLNSDLKKFNWNKDKKI